MWYKNIAGRFVGLVTKHACDRQTDGQKQTSLKGVLSCMKLQMYVWVEVI